METQSVRDGADAFDVTVIDTKGASRAVLFAVGGGGHPSRQHGPLLAALAARGSLVVAPHFERMSPQPTEAALETRARRLRLALDCVAAPRGLPVAGVGHSIGAMLLLAMSGGQAWMREGHKLALATDDRLDRLALMAPAAGYFQAPAALDAVQIPVLVWAAGDDTIAPPAQARHLERELGGRAVSRITEGAGHFSFLHTLPPHGTCPLPDREAFLAQLTREIGDFVHAQGP